MNTNRILCQLGTTICTMPLVFMTEITNYCNLKCVMCPHSLDFKEEKKGFMNYNNYKIIVDQAQKWGISTQALHKGGEVLLHKNWNKMVSYSKRVGIKKVYFATNGTLLHKNDNIKKLIECGIDYIIISIDGKTKLEYEELRSVPWSRIKENVNALLLEKKKKNSKLVVRVDSLSYENNTEYSRLKHKEFLKNEFPSLETNNISIRDFFEWPDQPIKYDIKKKVNNNRTFTGLCPNLYNTITINWDGHYVPCCQDLEGKEKMENAKEVSLKQFWSSNALRSLRRKLIWNKIDESHICKKCNVPYRNDNKKSLKYSTRARCAVSAII